MKWFLIGSLCLFCSITSVRADAAADLYNQGLTALNNEQYDIAAQAFDKIITSYPTFAQIDETHLLAGQAFIYSGKFTEAIDRLSKEAAPNAKPEVRPTGLYYTALAQFSAGQKNNDARMFTSAVTSTTSLIDLIVKNPTPDNKNYLESALYYRALANYELNKYDAAEIDLIKLTTDPEFTSSLTRPDYLLQLGSAYAVDTNQAVTDKKSPDQISALAQKALDAFELVSTDKNALVQANTADMSKAQVYFLLAQLDPTGAGYDKALTAFREVLRKDDLIPAQQQRLDELRTQAQKAAQQSAASGGKITVGNSLTLLIKREQSRLDSLKTAPDPIIEALIRIAECYVSMKQPDEARTILHRLIAHATLTPQQQQEVDFQALYSYVLGGQTDAANKALDAYLAAHASDPQADFISFQIASELSKRKDYAGALAQAQRSFQNFPKGRYAANALALQADMLNRLGRRDEADKVIADFLTANPTNPVANQMFLTKAASDTAKGDLPTALADYQKVRDNTAAGPDIQSAAAAGYIQTLNSLQKYDDVIREAKTYETKYPAGKAIASVMLFSAMAMDQKHDPAAVAALQDVAHKFPKEEASPFALSYVVNIYQRANNLPLMIQATKDLQTAYPDSYSLIITAADAVSTALVKEKKFDDAVALYQPLAQAPRPDIAADAQNKIGGVWLAAAKTIHYQSLPLEQRPEAEKRLVSAEQAYLGTLKNAPDQLGAVGDAFDGLVNVAKQRHSWGLLKEDADLEGYLTKAGADLTSPEMQARLEMAKAGLVFITKSGPTQYPASLDRFQKVIAANPGLRLTRQETDHYGELLLAAKDYADAEKVYNDLLDNAAPNDTTAHGSAFYGLGAVALAQGNIAQAKDYFLKLKALPGGGLWHPHINDANYGIALADEQSTAPADLEAARQIYGQLMQATQTGSILPAKAMLGYGRLLEKSGNAIKPSAAGPNEYAVHYYLEPSLIFGPATAEQSAEGLYSAGQAYDKAGDKANAAKQYDALKAYATSAPDWAAKGTSP